MKIFIKATKINLDEKLKRFIEKEISSLERFAKGIFGSKIKAYFKVAKETGHKKGPFFYAECQMRFPGKLIRSEALKENLKSAIIEVREELERQIKDYKRKAMAKIERGARKMKRELKVSNLAKKKEGKRVLEEGL